MVRLSKYVSKHLSTTKDYNFVSLTGGKFKLTNSKKFINRFTKNFCKLHSGNPEPLVFRPSENAPLFYLDIDLRSDSEIVIPATVYVEVAYELLVILKEVLNTNDFWRVILSKRQGSYYKGTLKEPKHCGGFHLIIPNLHVSVEKLREFRKTALKDTYWFSLFDKYNIINDLEGALDQRVLDRKCGLILIGLNKPQNKLNTPSSPHEIFFINRWKTIWQEDQHILEYGWMFHTKENNDIFKKALHLMYDWVFNFDYTKSCSPFKGQEINEKKPVSIPESSHDIAFDLEYFLTVLKDRSWDGLESEWKQLVTFCRISGLKHDYVCSRLNQYFKPSDLAENDRLWKSTAEDDAVGIGSVKRILIFFNVQYDEAKMFPGRKYRFHNEHRIFHTPNRVWKMYEIEEFFQDVYSYTWGEGSTKFIYEEEYWKTFGLKRYKNIGTVITDEMPFSKPKTDIRLMVVQSLEEQTELMEKMINKKIDKSESDDQMKLALKKKEE